MELTQNSLEEAVKLIQKFREKSGLEIPLNFYPSRVVMNNHLIDIPEGLAKDEKDLLKFAIAAGDILGSC